MSIKIADRMNDINAFVVMDILERAKELEAAGRHIIHMEAGEPDFDAPPSVCKRAVASLQAGNTHYTHSLGRLELRQAIADYFERIYHTAVSPEHIIITGGTSPAMSILFAALLNPGDETIIPDPYYCCYPNFIKLNGGVVKALPVAEENGFKYDTAMVRKALTSRTKAMIVNSPANPTGAVMTPAEMQAIADLGPLVISDEIYNGLIYSGEPCTMRQFTQNCVVVNGFSKLYAMTGFRLGYMIVPPELIRPLQILQQNFHICAGSFVQDSGLAALRGEEDYVASMVRQYDERRRFVLRRLEEMGIAPLCVPQGAFYVMANVKRYTDDSLAFAFQLLEEAGVAVGPGAEFGSNAEGYLRLSYATSLENLVIGMDRLEAYLHRLPLRCQIENSL